MNIPLNIIYEAGAVVVLNKQGGISVHPSMNEPQGTLSDALITKYPAIKTVGDDPMRPGIVHRLDKDTSGLLIVAKNQEAFEFLKREWQEGRVVKKFRDFSLVEVYPKTGRMHQIRVHMASIGCPVAGDKIYGGKRKNPEGLTHQFLYAFYLGIVLPGNKKMAFEADLPEDLRDILTKLEK